MSMQDRDELSQFVSAARNAPKAGKVLQAAGVAGIQGAAAEAVRQYHQEVLAFLIGALCLPLFVILLLPSVIFNGLANPAGDALTNDLAVAQNVIEIRSGISGVLQSDYEKVLEEINALREEQPYIDLTDTVAGQVSFNSLEILSMYCAHTGAQDYTRINIGHLVEQVRAHQGDYFLYETSTETRTDTVEKEIDGQIEQVQEEHEYTVYTLTYQGDAQFAELWELTDAERSTAADYAANLTQYLYEIQEREGISILEEISTLRSGSAVPVPEGGLGNPFNDPGWRSHITSRFGRRADVGLPGVNTTSHNGLDLAYGYGTPILAAQSGTVLVAKFHPSYGNYLVIDHGGGLCTLYAHCSQLLVHAGQTVSKYDTIARVGSTGDSTGSHLHLCVISDGRYVDPEQHLQ